MVKKIKEGKYELFETKSGSRVINLNGHGKYVWLKIENIGEVLAKSEKNYNPDRILAKGYFRLYDILNEPELTDLPHLEVCIGLGQWQGYLLPRGLPGKGGKHRIIPTGEILSKGVCNC